ncbi:septal ring lytic transglycosylase RlpA family protein [Marinifilum sp. D714]|uniref:septal ring lytic transglycosylase RlpA family protein n=1 Tax=Marinifilum sp. D714 TaxID=2937523 RepID=UPI0027CB9A78|nr:septal ring lytic transglycosylase RlpA family protein [Marinifilum sp. D714]MDQ2180151.1 septal ring lytic transglycosylase RlpA family protein [Marinifilum sp. D714]
MKIICIALFLSIFFSSVKSQEKVDYSEEGKASFYSDYFEGRKTSSGEIFHQWKYTAAHRSLPFGTWVKVVNLENKRSVIVLINDRGPFAKGRIIDLSKEAAKQVGNLNEGIFRVRISIYTKDEDYIKVKQVLKPVSNQSLSSSLH